jgi:hypothetical protein
MVAIVDVATAMMFRHTGIEEARWGGGVQELPRGVLWSCFNNRRGVGVAGWRGFMEEADRAELVHYADSFVNLRVLLLTG